MTRAVSPLEGTRAQGRRRREGWATTVFLCHCEMRSKKGQRDTLIAVSVPGPRGAPKPAIANPMEGGPREPSPSRPQTWGFPAQRELRSPEEVTERPPPMSPGAAEREAVSLGAEGTALPTQFCHPLQTPGKAFRWMPGSSTQLRTLGSPVLSTVGSPPAAPLCFH